MTDVYDLPRLRQMADAVDEEADDDDTEERVFSQPVPTPRRMQWVQTIAGLPLFVFTGIRWLLFLLAASWILRLSPGFEFLPDVPVWTVIVGLLVFVTPLGKMTIAAVAARLLLAGLRPGDYPRGGGVHLRLWLAEQIAQQVDPVGLAGAPWVVYYARALGARIHRDVDLHTVPPITGMLDIGPGASIEPEVDLTGYWIDGDTVRIGGIRIGADRFFSETVPEDYDAVILPGGLRGTEALKADRRVLSILQRMHAAGKLTAAVCAAPTVLAEAGLLGGRRATCYPGFEKELFGATRTTEAVVTDGNITTARGVGVAKEFAKELVRVLCGEEKLREISEQIVEN
jgi:putative intracellular protease/amidase